MPPNLPRRRLLGLQEEPRSFSLAAYYKNRPPSSAEDACAGIHEELQGHVEATRVGLGDGTAGTCASVPSLPELQDEEINLATASTILSDIEHGTDVLDIRLKGSAAAHVLPGRVSIGLARETFLRGSVAGVQIRYRHQGRHWCDTLMRTPTGARIVRIATDRVGRPGG
jgi:hypothetical protein